ncbi:ribonuclease H-like domain-containing protein [Tanacetum coccineum]
MGELRQRKAEGGRKNSGRCYAINGLRSRFPEMARIIRYNIGKCLPHLISHKFHADGSLSRYKAWLIANGRSQQLVDDIALLHSEFAMIDLGSLNYFLGISAQRSTFGKFLSQSKFAEEILERAHMQHCHLSRTPDDTESKLGSDGDPVSAILISAPCCAPTINLLLPSRSYLMLYNRFMYRPLLGLLFIPIMTRLAAPLPVVLRQNIMVLLMWLLRLLGSAICYFNISVQNTEIDIHFVHDFVASGLVRVLHMPSRFQYAYIFTKDLPAALFLDIQFSLNVQKPPAQTQSRTYLVSRWCMGTTLDTKLV